MARPRTKNIRLSSEERTELQKIVNSRTESASRVNRARALIALDEGVLGNKEIASKVGVSTVALSKLMDKTLAFGALNALNDLPRSGRSAVITDDDKAYVKHIACYKPLEFGYPEELWTQSKLAKHIREHCAADGYPNLASVSKSTVWKILDEDGLKPHRIRYYLERRDPEFHEKVKQVLMVYKEIQMAIETDTRDGMVTLSYDEKPSIQALGCTVDDDPMTLEHGFISRDSDYIQLIYFGNDILVTNDDGFMILGFILSDQFDQPIRMAVFPDEYKSTFIDRESVEGSVLEQADRAIAFIMRNNRTSSTFAGKYRIDVRAFPENAVREAVMNAIVHRDYSMDASTLISIFPDRLTIVSPGNLNTRFSKA